MLGVTEVERYRAAPQRVGGRAKHNEVTARAATLLAMLATTTSAGISVLAGLERGGSTSEQAVWICVGVVIMLAAHTLPGLASSVRGASRVFAFLLWAVAMAATGYTHATFFMNAQRHAGQIRAQRIRDVLPPPQQGILAGPSALEIAHERAVVLGQLASARAARCIGRCTKLALLRDRLTYRLDELNTAAAEATRRERAQDRAALALKVADEIRQQALTDPVTRALAKLAAVGTSTVNFCVALMLGWLLEGVACFSWTVALSGRGTREKSGPQGDIRFRSEACASVQGHHGHRLAPANDDVAQIRSAPVALRSEIGSRENRDPAVPSTSQREISDGEPNIESVAQAVALGVLRPTVSAIRAFVGCSEGRAMAIRRQLAIESTGVRP